MSSDGIWERADRGVALGWLDRRGRVPGSPGGVIEARVDCSQTRGPLAPIQALCQELRTAAGAGANAGDGPEGRGREALRRGLLGEQAHPDPLARLAAAASRVAEQHPHRLVALVVDQAQWADPDSVDVLAALTARAGAWPVALLLGVGPGEPEPRLAELLDHLRGRGALLVEGGAAGGLLDPSSPDARVSAETLALLRVACLDGPELDVARLAARLGRTPLSILLAAQAALDAGWPIEDLGHGRLRLPDDVAAELTVGLLPSLCQHLAPTEAPRPTPVAEAPARPPEPAEAPAPGPATTDPQALQAIDAYLRAAAEALGRGATQEALGLADTARELTSELSAGGGARLWGARALRLQAQVAWAIAGVEDRPGHTLTLQEARATAEAALAALGPEDPAEDRAEALVVLAGIHGDIGDAPSLDAALTELAQATRALIAADRVLPAARLLNDQAAIWMRRGDPVRAAHLLTEAQRLFSGDDTSPYQQEHAETQHLLARLALHAEPRPGMDRPAAERALGHAEAAIGVFRRLAQVRHEGRARETRARLLGRLGRHDEALGELLALWQAMEQLGDAEGMARVAGALAGVLAASHEPERALDVLSRSIALNHRIGSLRGLACNREDLDSLATRREVQDNPQVVERLDMVAALLHEAERGL